MQIYELISVFIIQSLGF